MAVLLIALFAGASFFFALAESALFALGQWQRRRLAERSPARGELVVELARKPHDLLATLALGNTVANAAMVASGMGAEVTVLDLNVERLRHLDQIHHGRILTRRSSIHALEETTTQSDLVIGAVLIPGARAPILISEEQVAAMLPGAVIVDISIDQGGCVATSRETTHRDPVYCTHGVIHYCVGNIPGAVPHTATYALSNATLPYVVALAGGVKAAVASYPELLGGVNIVQGQVTHAAVAQSLGVDHIDPERAIA